MALIVAAGSLAYWNSFSGPFLFDDQRSIVENSQIRQLWPPMNALRPPRETPVGGRPLVNLSFAINYAIGQLDVWSYHVVNLGLHLLCGLMLFGVIRRTLETTRLFSGDRALTLAGISALIWTVHPLQSEVVDYLTQRTESMMAFFYLSTLYSSIRAAGTDANRASQRWQAAAILCCVAGALCKESIVTAPVVVMLYDRVFLFPSFRISFRSRWRLYAGLALTWPIVAALMLEGPRASSVGFSSDVTAWTYLLNQAPAITHYLRLAIWPRGLVLDYGLPEPLTVSQVLPSILLLVGLVIATVIALTRRPFLGFLGAWFFITLAPTSSFVPISTEVAAERRMYLPAIALVVLAVTAGDWMFNRLRVRWQLRSAVPLLATAIVCVLCVVATVQRNREYRSRLIMAQTIVDRRPSGRGHFLLATELVGANGDHEQALIQFRESARTYPGGRYGLGTELIAAGKLDEGVDQLQEFVRLMPSHPNVIPAREMIGRVRSSQGKFDAAAEQFTLLLQMAPGFADAHGYLGDILLSQGNLQNAIAEYQKFLEMRPQSARAHLGLGLAWAKSGNLDRAIAEFRRSIEIDGGNDQAKTYLAYASKLKEQQEAARK